MFQKLQIADSIILRFDKSSELLIGNFRDAEKITFRRRPLGGRKGVGGDEGDVGERVGAVEGFIARATGERR